MNEIEYQRFEKLVDAYFKKHDPTKISMEEHAKLFLIFNEAAISNKLPHWLALELILPSAINTKFSDIKAPGKIVFDLPPNYIKDNL